MTDSMRFLAFSADLNYSNASPIRQGLFCGRKLIVSARNIESAQDGARFDRGRPLRREGQHAGEVLPGFFRIPPWLSQ
jgi:hypothetical protein